MSHRIVGALRIALATLLAAICSLGHAADKTRPNIVVLVADDLRFSDLGSFGSEIKTPHMDMLAKQGTRFSNFHVTASCSPTRSPSSRN